MAGDVGRGQWRLTGHFTGAPFQGIEPTGKPVEVRGLGLIELEGGEIVGLTAYYDGASFARQVRMPCRRAPAPAR